jgi:hypothetical protein
MPSLFSGPSDNAAAAAQATATASNAELGQEMQYVNQTEGQLRGGIAGLGPNPYFSAGANSKPTPIAPGAATNAFAAPPPPQQKNAFAAPPPNSARRQAQ